MTPRPLALQRLAVAAGKGGVGKTTVAAGVAALLAEEGRRVLLLDLDPQANAAWALGIDPAAPGVAALLLDRAPSPLPVADAPGLFVLPGGPALLGADVQALEPDALADRLPTGFGAYVMDCPPGAPHLERLALVAADAALVVTDAHPFALQGAARVLAWLADRRKRRKAGPRFWALVLSRVDVRRALDRQLEEAAAELWPQVPRLTVRQDADLAATTADRRPVSALPPDARGRADLAAVVRRLEDD